MSLTVRCVVVTLGILLWGCRSTVSPPAAVPAPAAPSLTGTTWRADDIDGGGALDRVPSTITFESAQRIVGSTGCNRYFASTQMTASVLRIDVVGSTRRACPPPETSQEQSFVTALGAVAAYRVEGATLLLLDETGRIRVRLTRAGDYVAVAHTFDCSGGPSFVLTPVGDAAELQLAGVIRLLAHQSTGSGVRYSDGEVSVWNRGRTALLDLDGRTFRCAER